MVLEVEVGDDVTSFEVDDEGITVFVNENEGFGVWR